MARLTIVYWRDIPAQVIVKAGRQSAKRQLSGRFETAIDRAAMRAKLRDSDSYLAEWRRAAPVACGDDLEAEAQAAADRL
ncbi:MAG: virulence factor, partial [Kiloniellaceae bacterium]